MTNATVARKRHGVQARARKKSKALPLASLIGLVVIAAVIAVISSRGGPQAAAHETGPVSVQGASLPDWSPSDPAVGREAPIVRGISFDGSSVTLPATGKATIVVFLAHWCSHCQADVTALAPLIARGLPSDVSIVSVSTRADPSLPNYPPSAWLRDARWTSAVLLDDRNNSVANAYGLQGTPLWVFIGADGRVRFRVEGELGVSAFRQAVDRLRAKA